MIKLGLAANSFFLLLVVVICAQQIQALKYSVCDSTKSLAEIQSIKVNDCDHIQEACPFVRGFNKSIELTFVPKQEIKQAKVKINGKLKASVTNFPVPFRVNPDNACGNYGFDCPLEAGKAYKFTLTLPILKIYPSTVVDVFFRLVDEKGDSISCVELLARIQDPQKSE